MQFHGEVEDDVLCKFGNITISENDSIIELVCGDVDKSGRINHLKISDSNLAYIPFEYIERTFNSIEKIEASNSNLSQVKRVIDTKEMTQWKELNFSKNEISELKQDDFKIFPDIETIDLSENEISKIHQEVFHTNKKLKNINMSKNKLKSLPINLLISLKEPHKLEFQNNEIDLIPDLMSNQNESRTDMKINFSNNKIISISVGFYDNLKDNTEINMMGNLCVSLTFKKTKETQGNLRNCFLTYTYVMSNSEFKEKAEQVDEQEKTIQDLEIIIGIAGGEFVYTRYASAAGIGFFFLLLIGVIKCRSKTNEPSNISDKKKSGESEKDRGPKKIQMNKSSDEDSSSDESVKHKKSKRSIKINPKSKALVPHRKH